MVHEQTVINIINKGNRKAEIQLYDEIGFWGPNNSRNLSFKLRNADKDYDEILMRINSPGGDVFEANAIYTILKSLSAKTVAEVEGIAASAASFILMGFDEVRISRTGQTMLHEMHTVTWGNISKLRETADHMENLQDVWSEIYAGKMGITAKSFRKKYFAKGKNTWLNAKESVKAGIAQEIYDGPEVVVLDSDQSNISGLAAKYQAKINDQNKSKMNVTKQHLVQLGLTDEATEKEITAALTALKEKAEKPTLQIEGELLESTDSEELKALKAENEKLKGAGVKEAIDAAVTAGKIKEGDREKWETVAKSSGLEAMNDLLGSVSATVKPIEAIKKSDKDDPTAPKGETLEDYMKAGTDAELLEKDEEKYKKLYEAHFGIAYQAKS